MKFLEDIVNCYPGVGIEPSIVKINESAIQDIHEIRKQLATVKKATWIKEFDERSRISTVKRLLCIKKA